MLTMEGGFISSHPTPSLSHLSRADFQDVYEPSEDTFLLMDALEKEAAQLWRMKLVFLSLFFFFFCCCEA